jgi:2-desacetyl-2-hydroxyethyl bacteriochlorophyllide A dehydrogenase
MRAIQITGGHKISVIECTKPTITCDEVLVKPSCCGICGTDLHILHHGFGSAKYPCTPGHEFAGRVVEVGRNVRHLKEGDFVAVAPNVVCGTCRWCKVGRPNLCIHLVAIGVGRAGAAAEYVAVPGLNALKVKETVGDGPAALIEPLACALHAVESSRGVAGRNILVIGGGTMGLLIALSANAQGASAVAISDPSGTKLDVARKAGITDARTPGEFEGNHFDVVFEAAGVTAALVQGISLLEKTGTLVQVGVHDVDKTVPINPFLLFEREQTFVGSHSCAEMFPTAVDLIQDIKPQAELMIGEPFSVWDFEAAVDSMTKGHSIKTQLKYD